jgi:uncharacterized repeat protein (TIGR03803 family)
MSAISRQPLPATGISESPPKAQSAILHQPDMKRIWPFLLVLLLLAAPAAVQAQFTCTTNSGTITITGYAGPGGALTIPSTINGYPVTTIGEEAFENCSTVTNVTIGTNVTSIGDYAFAYCALTSVTMPNSVTSIGDYAFYVCTRLTSAPIPASVTSIGYGVFEECFDMAAISVAANNPAYISVAGVLFNKSQTTLIEYPAGNAATSYMIPASVISIGYGAFSDIFVPNVTIPSSVTDIANQAFFGSGLTSVTIPQSVTNIGSTAFGDCGAMTAFSVDTSNPSYVALDGVLFNKSQTTLIEYPAAKVGTSFTIPSSVTSIGVWAFADCGLTSVTIPNSVTSIGDYAFAYSSLASVTIPNSITTIGYFAFTYSSSLANVTIPDTVTSIGDYAFAYCALTSVTMPNSVTSIGEYAFAYSTSLTSVYFEGNAPTAASTVFANESNVTVYYLSGTTGWSSTFAGVPTVELAGIVAFSANPTNGGVPLTVSFTSAAVDSGGNAITNWNWNFGDGSTSTAQNPSHTYTAVGTFSPALIATNSAAATIFGVGPPSITVTTATSNGFTVVYSYDSPTFSGVTPGSGLTSTNFVSASVTYSNVLAPNLQDASPNRSLQPDLPTSWVFSDGVEQWTPANSHFYVAQVNTDANGNIIGWNFNLYSNPGFSEPEVYISSSTPTSYGSVEVDLPLSGPYQTAYVEYGPGVDIAWRRTVAPAPTGVPITAAPTNGLAPLTVNFSAASVDSAGNAITRWNWTFGDGSTSTNQNPSHTYTAVGATVGAFYPTLVATNNIGGVVIGYGPSLITASNLLVAFSANPTNGRVPLTVSFTSAAVDSAGNAITNWNWSFGDGSTGTAQNPSHTYTAGGTFSPALIATNNIGEMVTGVGLAAITAISDTILHSFTNGVDGAYPVSGLLLSGNTLYGTAGGGRAGNGTVFAIKTDGTGFTNLYSFSSTGTNGLNSDGANPSGNLILSGNTLYGTANGGGSGGSGTVFAIKTDGTGFTKLYSFTALDPTFSTNSDGAYPVAGLLLSGNTLYGTAGNGGSEGSGTVFAVTTNGTGFTNLHSFTAVDATFFTNSDGVFPFSELISSGNILYGTANRGGIGGSGTVFAIKTDGTGFTNLYSFTALDATFFTNSDGAYPYSELISSGNTLYGTANGGGSGGSGTVFAIKTDGTGFTKLYSFTALDPTFSTNRDGANPQAGLILSGNTLYGTAESGGTWDLGTVFAVKTDGEGFTNLCSFTGASDGAYPCGTLVLSGNTLYGTTENGGSSGNGTVLSGNGTVFSLILPVGSLVPAQPGITGVSLSGANLVLNGINGQSGGTYYALMSTNLALPLSQWTPVATNVLSAGGNFTITATNTVTRGVPQRFYILQEQ